MRTIIAGGRDYILTADDWRFLDTLEITMVISGCARGADTGGEQWAKYHEIRVEKFPANWEHYGKKAGYIRNKLMAESADAVVLFPGGKGTDMMHKIALEKELIIYDKRTPVV